jgi:hypothetical protein
MEEEGVMRSWTFWLTWLLAAASALLPLTAAPGQEVPPADPVFPFPLYSTRPERGGLFVDGSYVMYRQTNPLQHQPIAFRGFFDVDGSITGRPGRIVGSGTPALFADDAGGPGTYQPGVRVGIGWRFEDGLSVELSWMNLMKAQYFHVISGTAPFHFQTGPQLADTYISAPVFNFPPEYSGPQIDGPALQIPTRNGVLPNLNAGYGVWNAADVMSIEFDQRYEQIDLIGRVPIFETDCDRCYGLVGGRFAWIWERFKWRTVDQGFLATSDLSEQINVGTFTGNVLPALNIVNTTLAPDQDPRNVAIYTNIVSNRMYGPVIGIGNECYLGHGFSVSTDLLGMLALDVVKERATYEPGLDSVGSPKVKRAITQWTAAAEVQASIKLWWYPIEGVQVNIGYDLMGFFNTIAAPNPVSFDYGALDPAWEHKARLFDGLQAGLGLIF